MSFWTTSVRRPVSHTAAALRPARLSPGLEAFQRLDVVGRYTWCAAVNWRLPGDQSRGSRRARVWAAGAPRRAPAAPPTPLLLTLRLGADRKSAICIPHLSLEPAVDGMRLSGRERERRCHAAQCVTPSQASSGLRRSTCSPAKSLSAPARRTSGISPRSTHRCTLGDVAPLRDSARTARRRRHHRTEDAFQNLLTSATTATSRGTRRTSSSTTLERKSGRLRHRSATGCTNRSPASPSTMSGRDHL